MKMKKILSTAISAAYIASLAVVPAHAASIATDINDYDTIAFDRGTIKLDSTLKLTDLEKRLVLKKSNGEAITGGQYVRAIDGDETYEYELVFGDLDYDTAYTLYYGSDEIVMFDSGSIAFEEDFDDWTDADLTALVSETGKDNLYLMKRDKDSENDPIVT